jgi:hypothetical protein
MTKAILKDQMYKNVFAYVDDNVVASKKKATQINDLAKTFVNMRGATLNLNLKNGVFGAQRGKVLGCVISVKGIDANQDKNQFNSAYEAFVVQKRSLVAYRQSRSAEPIHVEAGRAKPTILHCAQGL